MVNMLRSIADTNNYYRVINAIYQDVYGEDRMLHYPMYYAKGEDLKKRQENLVDFLAQYFGERPDSCYLEVGCGNGQMAKYIHEKYKPSRYLGIDINSDNLVLANRIVNGFDNLSFHLDNAEELSTIEEHTIDVLLCVESACLYRNKSEFLKQVRRVLKDDGIFIIADILNKRHTPRESLKSWKDRMHFHHWSAEDYHNEFKIRALTLRNEVDITDLIIDGYKGYYSWISRKECPRILKLALYKIFLFAQVKINIYLLKNRRRYWVFVGSKEDVLELDANKV